eukprot:4197881-Pyramimonas_sp.AAC.1
MATCSPSSGPSCGPSCRRCSRTSSPLRPLQLLLVLMASLLLVAGPSLAPVKLLSEPSRTCPTKRESEIIEAFNTKLGEFAKRQRRG